MQQLVAEWYVFLSRLNAAIAAPVNAVSNGIGIPLVSVLLFGLMGATSPCQLTTNAGALAYLARGPSDRRSVVRNALAFVVGKVLVYTVLGIAVILAGRQLAQSSIPIIVIGRKALGPMMILMGMYLLGWAPLRFSLGRRVSAWLEARAGVDRAGAFLLGIAFSFAFCPTLFLLFFGLTIPLALQSPVGVSYPAVFALGASVPLLVLIGLFILGGGATTRYRVGAARINSWLRPAAAVVFLLAGMNDTVIYWFL